MQSLVYRIQQILFTNYQSRDCSDKNMHAEIIVNYV